MKQEQRNALLNKLTLKEKIYQMTQVISFLKDGASSITGILTDLDIPEEDYYKVGSIIGEIGAERLMSLQEKYLEQCDHGIPLIFMADIIHGYKTIFPIPLAIGCSFDETAAERMARVSAIESAASGLHVTFAPMVDLIRDPRWGRVIESTGEDPYLNAKLGSAFVRGYQKDLNPKDSILACAKHFVGYGASEGGRDYNTVDLSWWQLYENYLPSFKACIDEGVALVMASFNIFDGVPVTGNKAILHDLLKTQLGFDGVVISDWGAVKELIYHGVAENEKDCAQLALDAGIDMEMMTPTFIHHLEQLSAENPEFLKKIDDAVLKILELKNKLGLFENPFAGADPILEKKLLLCEEHRLAARDIARKSIVLLKNDGLLPVQTEKKIALVGPFGETQNLLGPWSIFGNTLDCVSIGAGLRNNGFEVSNALGCDFHHKNSGLLDEAVAVAKNCDIIFLALGETEEDCGEAGSKANLRLPACQIELLHEMKKLNKPMLLILTNGRPLILTDIVDEVDGILETWYLGTETGNAIGDVIRGTYNPSGKLAMSFPYHEGQIPVYYNHYRTGRPKEFLTTEPRYKSCYLDIPNEPLFPFGFGLSYSDYEYANFQVDEETLTLSVDVKNTGKYMGTETVQFYVGDMIGKVTRPVKQLIGFQKVQLYPGAEKSVRVQLNPKDLVYNDTHLNKIAMKGKITIFVGTDSTAQMKKFITL